MSLLADLQDELTTSLQNQLRLVHSLAPTLDATTELANMLKADGYQAAARAQLDDGGVICLAIVRADPDHIERWMQKNRIHYTELSDVSNTYVKARSFTARMHGIDTTLAATQMLQGAATVRLQSQAAAA